MKGYVLDYIDENEYHKLERALKKFNVPIIYNVDIGHIPPQMYIINGSYAEFEFNDGKGKLIQRLV